MVDCDNYTSAHRDILLKTNSERLQNVRSRIFEPVDSDAER
jgi:hypothetical protein